MTPEQFARGFVNYRSVPAEDAAAFGIVRAAVLYDFKQEVRRAFLAAARMAAEAFIAEPRVPTEAPIKWRIEDVEEPIHDEGEFRLMAERSGQVFARHVRLPSGPPIEQELYGDYFLVVHVNPRDGHLYPVRLRIELDALMNGNTAATTLKLAKWVKPFVALEFPHEQAATAPERILQVWLVDWLPFHSRLSKNHVKLYYPPRF